MARRVEYKAETPEESAATLINKIKRIDTDYSAKCLERILKDKRIGAYNAQIRAIEMLWNRIYGVVEAEGITAKINKLKQRAGKFTFTYQFTPTSDEPKDSST